LDWHGFQVCGEASNGRDAIERVIALKPEIVILDINMPVMSGTQAAVEIRRLAPATKILVFTVHDAPELVTRLRPFAHGFVSKSAAGTELIPMISRLAGTATDNRPRTT
jgi:DNA-binding NarL/FixJ family response regulator